MTDDVALRARAIGSLDRVDPEGQIAPPVEDARIDDPLDELSVGRAGFDGRLGVGRAVGWVGRARTGSSGPGGRIGQAATCSRSEIRLAPLSASNRCSLV